MKYINLFENQSAYEQAGELSRPQLAMIKDSKTIHSLSVLPPAPEGPKDNEIWYKTVNNEPWPVKEVMDMLLSELGDMPVNNVISNTYNAEKGYCILECEKPITVIGINANMETDEFYEAGPFFYIYSEELNTINELILPECVETFGTYALMAELEDPILLTELTIPAAAMEFQMYSIMMSSLQLKYKGTTNSWTGTNRQDYSIVIDFDPETGEPGGTIKCSDGEIDIYAQATEVVYSADGKILMKCPIDYSEPVIVNEGTLKIAKGAFMNCESLTSVALNEGLETIGEQAFMQSGISSINIPNSVTEIGQMSFAMSALSEITLSNNLKSIEYGALAANGISEITIPASVTYIDSMAFMQDVNLSTMIYAGTINEWKGIPKGESWHEGCPVEFVTCIDGSCGLDEQPDDIVYSTDGKILMKCPNDYNQSVSVTDGTEIINRGSFMGCIISELTLPASITEIQKDAFAYCENLNEITFNGTKEQWRNIVKQNGYNKDSALLTIHCTDGDVMIYEIIYNEDETVLISCPQQIGGTITVKDTVKEIGEYAFDSCYKLKGAILPDGLEIIGEGAFSHCKSLESINIPNSVTSIGEDAFYYCESLETINYNGTSSEWELIEKGSSWKSNSSIVYIQCTDKLLFLGTVVHYRSIDGQKCQETEWESDNMKVISNEYDSENGGVLIVNDKLQTFKQSFPFNNKSNMLSIEIPDSVTSIGSSAFQNCSRLTSINIPNSATSIGNSAFGNCSSLTSITIPDKVTSIEAMTFYGCSSLTSINIPDSVTNVGDGAFVQCSGLTSINIPNSVTSIGNNTFKSCSGLTNITIPNSVTSIGSYAFYDCSNLTSINIPDSVTSIRDNVFNSCSSLTSINIPNSATSIGNSAFGNCSSLTSITIPDKVTSIGGGAFYGCSSLTSINIPNSVTSIRDSVFQSCSSLTSINIPNSVTSIGSTVFNGCSSLTSINIPNSVTSIGSTVFNGCSSLTSITSLNTTPPSIQANTFFGVPISWPIYVPASSVDAYKSAQYWSDRASQIQPIPVE